MSQVTNLEKMRRLPWQYAGNAFNVIFWFTAASGSVFVLFLNELGFGKARIGFLLSLVPFCGPIALVVAPYAERIGFKRTFLSFFGFRKIVAASFLFTPLMLARFGTDITFIYVACLVFAFAMCRAISETAIYPWSQEMVPDAIRGKFSAINNIISMAVSIATVVVAGYCIKRWEGVNTFVYLIGGGIVAGVIAVWCYLFVPGGAPVKVSHNKASHFQGIMESLRDTNYRRFIIGLVLVSIPVSALMAFAPLFMKEKIGLSAGIVIWLDAGIYSGSLIFCYIWGWTSDRYGSKPVMLLGALLWISFPGFLFFMPRHQNISAVLAITATFIVGITSTAWAIGFTRYLFVTAVPPKKKTVYMAVFYASAGIAGGSGPLLGGWLLKACSSLDTKFLFFNIDEYTPLFIISALLLFSGVLVLSKVRGEGAMPVRKFVGMFLQGNALLAAGSMVRYYRATDEQARVLITERLGYANNPLSTNELIEALNDPSFNVRYEAIIAIAHMRPNPELTDALILVLGGNEPDLSLHTAWALGKLGDQSAVVAIREMLMSDQPLLRARSARALATLDDKGSIPTIVEYFKTERSPGLRIAYAQGLGKMRDTQALAEMLDFLRSLNDEMLRSEMALAVARIVGDESKYIQLWRQLHDDPATIAAQYLLSIRKDILNSHNAPPDMACIAESASSLFARGNVDQGIIQVVKLLNSVACTFISGPIHDILLSCAQGLSVYGQSRREYLLLSLHTLEVTARKMHSSEVVHKKAVVSKTIELAKSSQ